VIDLSNLKSPGWAKVVQELSAAAPDDRSFLERLLAVITQVSAARQGVLYMLERGEGDEPEPRPASVWPPPANTGGAHDPNDGHIAQAVEMATEAKSAARAAASSGQARAFGLDKQDVYYDGSPGRGYVLAVPVMGQSASGAPVAGAVITLLIEPRGREAVRSTLAMAEVLAGYVHAHGARQALRRTQQASAALDLATRLIASINNAPNFKGAAMQLTNDLAKQFGVDRVALGWIRTRDGDEIKVEAISDTEHFDRRMAMVQKLQAAMDECLDQEQPVLYPPPPAEGPHGDVLLAQAITHAHRELAAGDAKLKVCSLPLRIDDHVVGVVTIETAGEGAVELSVIELIQSALDLIAPVLRIRRSDDRIVAARAWDSMIKGGAWLVGPRHTAWKIAGVLVLAALTFVSLYRITYRVGAEAVLEPRDRRIISVPLDGVIARLGTNAQGRPLEPGDSVKAGDVLVELDDTEWKLSAIDARQKIAQAELEAAAAAAEGDRGRVERALAQKARAKAELDVYEYRINKAKITAPISGTILGGRLTDRVGASVKLGDALMEIAPLDDMIAVIRVDERDIALVARAFEDGDGASGGELATKGRPTDPVALTLERIVPLSEARDGVNAYEVRARLERVEPWMRPGMEGRARLDTQRHSLLWIGTRRLYETVRMWLW
jgi:hypothetical protein